MGIVFPFPSLLLDVLAIGVYRNKFVIEKFYKKLPLFRHQPTNDIMWAHLPSSSRLSGQREVMAVNLSTAPFPVHPCGSVAVLENNPNLPPPCPLGREQGGSPQPTDASLANVLAVEYSCGGLLVFLLITSRLVLCSALWWVFTLTSQGSRRLAQSISLMLRASFK